MSAFTFRSVNRQRWVPKSQALPPLVPSTNKSSLPADLALDFVIAWLMKRPARGETDSGRRGALRGGVAATLAVMAVENSRCQGRWLSVSRGLFRLPPSDTSTDIVEFSQSSGGGRRDQKHQEVQWLA